MRTKMRSPKRGWRWLVNEQPKRGDMFVCNGECLPVVFVSFIDPGPVITLMGCGPGFCERGFIRKKTRK